jgi:type I restriction enzyme, S subunit
MNFLKPWQMDSTLMVNKVLNLDKTSWKLTKVGDLAKDISKRVDNPGESEYDRFVGLGNFVSGDIKIKTWETTENLASSAKAFNAGDILFARRNAYLRRASLVDFDGCCSGDAFVLRENHDKIVPGFLAFLMNSNALWDYANSNAAGTMSKRVKWRDLAEYEFLLPPKDQQAQLAKLLWAMDEIIEREKEVLGSVELKIKSTQKMLFSKVNYPRIKLNKYSTILGGYAFSSKSFINEGVPVIKIKNIVKGEILVDDDSNYITPDVLNLDKYVLSQGDILIAMTGATLGKIGVVQNKYDGAFLNQRVGKFQMKKGIDRWFMKGVLDSEYFLNELNKYIGEGAQGNISSEDVSKTLVPNLSESEMSDFGQKFESLYNSIKSLGNKISSSKSLQKSLINQIF